MNQLIPVLEDCIVPFFDPFDLANFMRASHTFHAIVNREVAKWSQKYYLFHYRKKHHDIKYLVSAFKDTHKFSNVLYVQTAQLKLFRVTQNNLVTLDTFLCHVPLNIRTIICVENDLTDLHKLCKDYMSNIWIGPQSFSVTLHYFTCIYLFIFTQDHYGDHYEACYKKVIKTIESHNPYRLAVRYGTDKRLMHTIFDGTYVYHIDNYYIYPARYKLYKTIEFKIDGPNEYHNNDEPSRN